MDDVKEQHERAVGDVFIAAFNKQEGVQYVFDRMGGEAPDLVYRDGDSEICLEVTGCYYDANHARFVWMNARNLPHAADGWGGVNFSQALVANINATLRDKCAKDYGPNCILLVYVSFNLTTFKDMEALLPKVEIPAEQRFAGIYLVGYFGVNNDSLINHAIVNLAPDSRCDYNPKKFPCRNL